MSGMWRNVVPSLTKAVRKAPRAMFGVFVILVLALSLANTVVYMQERDSALSEALRDRRSAAVLAAAVVEERLSRIVATAAAHSAEPALISAASRKDWSGSLSDIDAVVKSLPYVTGATIFDPNGNALSSVGSPASQADAREARDWLVGVDKAGKPYVSSAFASSPGGEMDRAAVVVPVKVEGSTVAYLALEVGLESLLGWNREVSFGREAVPYFVDRDGRVALQADKQVGSEAAAVASGDETAKALGGETGSEIVPGLGRGDRDIVAYAPVDSFGWAVVTVQPMQVALGQFNDATRMNLIVQVVTVFGCLALLFLLVIAIRRLGYLRKWESGYIHSSADALVAIDADWLVTVWNPEAERLTGWSRREAMGRPFRELVKFVRERDRSENVLFISDAMLSGQARLAGENTILIARDGKEMPVGESAAPIKDEDGKTIGAVVVFHDTTKERGEAMIKSSFAYAHHQLRTPVTAAMWNLELALEDCDDKVLKDRIKKALVSMESVKKLVNELIEVSELEHGIVVPKGDAVDLRAAIATDVEQLKEKATARKVKVAIGPIPPSLELYSDRKLLARAIYELLDNAVSYSLPRGKVELRVSLAEQGVIIEVEDRGIGIPPEQQGIVYTKFFRGHNIPPESIGAGLGLHIASELVKLLGGKMWFRSEQGAGTVFYISLPHTRRQPGR